MKKNFLLILVGLFLLATRGLAQTPISGVINSYTDVSIVDYANNALTVSDASGFSIGNKILVIQMQGATIDESQSSGFGTINNYNDAGNYEIKDICNIQGNDITVNSPFLNTYDPNGAIQIVLIPTYANAIISGGDLTAPVWNGVTGGVLILEVDGTLNFGTQQIDLSGTGFKGGAAVPSGSGCSFVTDNSYYTPLSDVDATALKGEGISQVITNKECGRGPQANGGGGGNNHNGGGCGGGNYGEGGAGGQRIKSSAFTCGSDFGINSHELSLGYSSNKIFMGGGGGAGHGNNPGTTGESGYNGGGIVIIIANSIEGNNQSINVNGNGTTVNSNSEGGGGGGAGGTVLLDVINYNSTLNVFADGGGGTNVDNVGTSNCSGPGGGGGGGLIWISNATQPANLNYSVLGGAAGITATTSQSNCTIGDSNGALAGQDGGFLTGLTIPENTVITSVSINSCGTYTVPSGDETYTASGTYSDTLSDIHGCDSLLSITVTINSNSFSSIAISECSLYSVPSGDESYSSSGIYMDTIPNFLGCDSILTIDLTIAPVDLSVSQNGANLNANAASATFQWIDCNSGLEVTGATNAQFTPDYNGAFAVIVTQGSCADTSICYTVTDIGFIENTFNTSIEVYPNPFQDELFIRFGEDQNLANIKLTDIAGRTVYQTIIKNQLQYLLEPNLSEGIYLIIIESDGQRAVKKIIKQ